MRKINGKLPGNTAELISFLYSCLQNIIADLVALNDLCVVVVTTSA